MEVCNVNGNVIKNPKYLWVVDQYGYPLGYFSSKELADTYKRGIPEYSSTDCTVRMVIVDYYCPVKE